MAKRNQPPRVVQRLTGWSYMKALRFVREHQAEAEGFAVEEGITTKEALLRMAAAEIENG